MAHRHLLPNEIDLLVDAEVGFGVAPLRAHVAECAECRARVTELADVAASLDTVPHFVPRREFSDRVMAQVQVIEPWHVAALETAKRALPSSVPMRVLVTAGAGAAAVAISGSAAWLAYRADVARWAFDLLLDRGRDTVVSGASAVAADALGTSAVATSSGFTVLAVALLVLGATATLAIAGFRRLAARAHSLRA